MSEQLDSTDSALLLLLQEDGRATYAAMAKTVGLSAAAVRKRVNRLFERGVVRGMVVVDPLAMGVKVAALAGIRHDGALGGLEDAVRQRGQVIWAAVTSGRYDMMIEIGCGDTEELISIVNEVRELPAVRGVEILNILRYVKFDQQSIELHPTRS